MRCGKEKYEIGKITDYGPACKSCAFYFKEPKPCESCGKPSRRLSTYKHLDHDLNVCLKCSRSNNGTCNACKRYRLLYTSETGDDLCKTCLEIGEKPCEKCGQNMPAGYGLSCEDCYWSELISRRIADGCKTLENENMRARFREFGYWLYDTKGPNRAAIKINNYLPLFQEIDIKWNDVPDYNTLIDFFGANKLRLFRLPIKWFNDVLGIKPDENYKLEITEKNRIVALTNKIELSNPLTADLISYEKILFKKYKENRIKIRSIRLAISAVCDLINNVIGNVIGQKGIDDFLNRKPGQKANLTGFINYYNQTHNTNLILRVDKQKARSYRQKKLQEKMLELQNQSFDDPKIIRRWHLYGLQYFHNLPSRVSGTILKNCTISIQSDGYLIFFNNKNYFIPDFNSTFGVLQR